MTTHRITTIAGVLLAATVGLQAADINKANNTDALNLTTSWVGGVVPATTDMAVWDSTVTSALANSLGTNLTFKGIRVTNPGGNIQLNTGSTLTLGVSGIDLSSATQNLGLSNAVAIGGGTNSSAYQKWTVTPGRTLTFSSTLTKNGVGTPLNGVNNGLVEFSTTGTISSTNISRVVFNDSQNNPFALYGPSDWAATDSSGNIVAANYTPAAGTMTAGVINDIQGDTSVATVDVVALRFNDPVPRTVTITGNNTHTARGILVTANSGGGTIIGGNIRPSRGASGGAAPTAFPIIQNSSSDFTIASTLAIASSSTPVHLIKYGKGNLILASTFVGGITGQGGCTVMEGTLTLNGAPMGSGTNVVNQGKLVVRSGTIPGAPANIFNTGATNGINVAAANGQVIETNVTFAAGSTTLEFLYANGVPMSPTTAPLFVAGTLTVNATINLAVVSGGITVGQFPLLKYGTLAGAGYAAFNTTVALPPHVTASLSNNTANSTIDLVVTAVTTPLRWATGNGTWDINTTANWKDNTGASSTYQQVGALGDSVLFEDSLSGSSPIAVALNTTVVPTGVTFSNNTKAYTLNGIGGIAGIGGLTKAGSGSFTLATANTFPGGLNLNGGVLTFSANNNLGSGAITFGGGTLQYAPGNTTDISTRTVTLGAGGGTIDVGANNVTYAGRIGNGGGGGLTKVGSGTLTLSGVNNYSGNTVVGSGTLALANPASVSNSVAVILNSGTSFDLNSSGNTPIVLNGAVSQMLAGSGTVYGGVTVPVGATISPATNGTVGTLTLNTGDLALNGGTYACDLSAGSRDLILVGGSLTINSGTLVLNVSGSLPLGTYKLIQYSGGFGGSSGNLTVTGFSEVGKAASLSDAVAGEINLVISATASDALTWSGAGPTWNLTNSLSWLNVSTPWAFTNGDLVTFNDTGAILPNVSIVSSVAPSSITVTSDSTGYSFDDGTGIGGGKITGSASLTKNGTTVLVVNTVNDNTGVTVINGGTLQVSGSIGSGSISNNAELVYATAANRSITSLSGPGNLTQSGAATTLTLLGANANFSGGVSIGGGATLQVGNGGAVGSLGSGAVVANNGTLTFNKTGTWSLTNSIQGAGGVSLVTTSTATMTASNNYTGVTSVSGGAKLILGNANALAGAGPVTVQANSTADINANNMTVARLSSTLNAGGRLVNNAGTATNVLTINYDGTGGTADSSIVIADNDGTGGRIRLVKDGAGTQMFRAASTYSGGTIINAGALQARQQDNAFGSSTNVILNGGTVDNFASTLGYTFTTTADSGIYSAGNCTFTGPFIGTNNLLVTLAGNVTSGETISWGSAGQLTNFSGRFTCVVDATTFGRFWRWAHTANTLNGSSLASWDLQGNVQMSALNVGYTILLGSLEGAVGTSVNGNNTTYIVGGKGTNTTFSGNVIGTGSFVKTGSGTLTLDQSYSFFGATVVSNSTLALTGTANPTNSSTIRVASGALLDLTGVGVQIDETNEVGVVTNSYFQVTHRLDLSGNTTNQTLTGSGTVRGSVVASANSTINPGDGIGTLTVATNVALGGIVLMELNRTNSPATNDMLAATSITGGGTLTVTNLGPALYAGDTFKLFNQPVGGFVTVNLPQTFVQNGVTNNYGWLNKISVDGTIQVTSGAAPVNTTPTNITYTALSGNQIALSWPSDHVGWRVLTNSVDIANTNFWFQLAGSAATNQVIITTDSSKTNVFFRMVYP